MTSVEQPERLPPRASAGIPEDSETVGPLGSGNVAAPPASLEPAAEPSEPAAEALAEVQVRLAAKVARATRLEEIGAPVERMVDIVEALDEMLRVLVRSLDARAGALLLYDAERQELRTKTRAGHAEPRMLAEPLGLRHPACNRIVATSGPLARGELAGDHEALELAEGLGLDGMRAYCGAPMTTLGGELMGTVLLTFDRARGFRARDVELVQVCARHAAEMVERARLHGEARLLAERERVRSEQLRRLADAALAVSRTFEVDDILRVVTEAACEIVGTHLGIARRLPHGWAQAAVHVHASARYAAWRDGDGWPSEERALDVVTRENRAMREAGCLAAPLAARDGSNLGFVQLAGKRDGTEFTPEDEAMLVQLAHMAAARIEHTELLQREREARGEAEERARLQQMLAEASVALAASLDLEEVLRAISGMIVPELADWCSVSLLRPSGRIEPVSENSSDPRLAEALRAIFSRAQANLDRPHGIGAVIRTGRSQFLPEIPDQVWREFALSANLDEEELRGLGVRSAIVVPLPRGGSAMGAVMLLRSRPEPYTQRELTFAEDLAARAALAIDNAARYTVERRAADILQRSLLPRALPRIAGVRLASRYLPGGSGTRIGGDWYDLIELDGQRLALVVGDVMGRGIPAATVMGQLRAAVRAYALEGHQPAALMELLDRLVERIDAGQLTTCVYAVYDTVQGTLTIASAGHPAPLVVDARGDAAYLDVEPDLPLGTGSLDSRARTQCVRRLEAGATLLLYTDGLVEGRDCPVDEGMRRLRDAAAGWADEPDRLCERLVKAMGRDGHHDDDTALLALTVTPELTAVDAGPDALFGEALVLPADLRSPGQARQALQEMLARWGLAGSDTVVLAAHELVTNAVLHGGEPIVVRVSHRGDLLRVEVADGGERPPFVQRYGEDAFTGRGLALVDALVERWGWYPAEHGKVVWCEVAL